MTDGIKNIYYCTGCIWADTCENEEISIDGVTYKFTHTRCDDYSPAGLVGELTYYEQDLRERYEDYQALIEEYQ